MAGRRRVPPPPPPQPLPAPSPSPRPAPWGPGPLPHPPPHPRLPEAASRRCCPCNPSGLPGGAAGTTGGGANPQPRPPTGRSARREGGWERGTPGRGALRLLIPLKVADQRRWYRGKGGAAGGGGLARASAFPLLCGLGLPRQGPQAASSGGGGSGCERRTAGLRESCPSAPTGPSWNLPLPGGRGRVFVPTTPRERNCRMPGT